MKFRKIRINGKAYKIAPLVKNLSENRIKSLLNKGLLFLGGVMSRDSNRYLFLDKRTKIKNVDGSIGIKKESIAIGVVV